MADIIKLDANEMNGARPGIEPPDNFVIAGGSVRRWFLGEPQNSDIDLFRTDGKQDYDVEIVGAKRRHETVMAINYDMGKTRIQVIKKSYESVSDMFDAFDFHHCQFAYNGDDIFTTKKAIISAMRKHLSLNTINPDFELDTLRRAFKYCRQGFYPCAGTIGDLANALRDSDSDFDEQLQMSPGGGTKTIIRFD